MFSTFTDTRERDLTGYPFVRSQVYGPVPYPYVVNWALGTTEFGQKKLGTYQRVTSVRTKKIPKIQLPPPPKAVLSKDRNIRRLQLEAFKKARQERSIRYQNSRPDPFKQWYRRAWEKEKRARNRLLNPHPCMLWKREVTSVQSQIAAHEPMPYQPGKVVVYTAKGDLCLFGVSTTSPFLPVSEYYNDNSAQATIGYLTNRALIKTYSKLKAPAMPGLTYLGELTETLRMLRKPLSGLRLLFTDLRRYTTRGRRSLVPEALRDQWLEYRYGFMPLYYQIEEIREAFEKQVVCGYPIRMVRSGIKSPKKVMSSELDVDLGGYFRGKVFRSDTYKEGAFCSLATTLQMDESRFLGLSWLDVPATIWELIPYSFVLDWFFNVGDWIQAVMPNPKLKVLASSVSIKLEHIVDYQIGAVSFDVYPRVWDKFTTSNCRFHESKLVRVVNPNLPILPVGNKDFFRYKRVLDTLALTHGLISNLLRR